MKISRMFATILFGVVVAGTAGFFMLTASARQEVAQAKQETQIEPSKLGVLWTSGDREVALKMVFMYTYNAKRGRWWDEVRFIIWGPSSKLLSDDEELQQGIRRMQEAGIETVACKACADMYGVSDQLTELGVEVKYMGRPLTSMLKSEWVTLTF